MKEEIVLQELITLAQHKPEPDSQKLLQDSQKLIEKLRITGFSGTNKVVVISPQTELYDRFILYTLQSIDLLDIDHFLKFQLCKYFKDNKPAFNRYIKLSIRKNDDIELSEKQHLTMQEWMELNEIPDSSPAHIAQTLPFKTLTSQDEKHSDLLTAYEAAQFLNIKLQTLYGKTSKKEIPHIKKGKKLLFEKKELENWLYSGKVNSQHEIESLALTHLYKGKRKY